MGAQLAAFTASTRQGDWRRPMPLILSIATAFIPHFTLRDTVNGDNAKRALPVKS
ncbi:MAG: hypothetical protein IKP00_06220 [Victivallales bacterium]|nr:hypothetical protein [Victivallales bacterium]